MTPNPPIPPPVSGGNPPPPAPGPSNAAAAATPSDQQPYVPIKDYDPFSVWSNDPKDMQISTYFTPDPKGTGADGSSAADLDMTLAGEFGLPGLKPVIVKWDRDVGNTYLLKDDQDEFYMWNESDGRLWRFKDKPKQLEDVVNIVLTDSYGGDVLVQQFASSGGSQAP